ncbi:MAG: hypothetical protein LC679_18985 [Intrasporangiaceae bacterium]|nr:hypothetical protein [Intrasporangiaceae bacterium]
MALDDLTDVLGNEPGRTLLVGPTDDPPVAFTVAERATTHVGHWYECITGELPARLRFLFDGAGEHRVAVDLRAVLRVLTHPDSSWVSTT